MSLPQISDAEFEIMNIIWKYAPINTNDLVERLTEGKGWNPKTTKTMLFRLEKKGAITHEKESRIFVYSPLVKKEAYLEAESATFLNRFFDGAFSQMVVSYLDKSKLTADDINELQAILDKKGKQ